MEKIGQKAFLKYTVAYIFARKELDYALPNMAGSDSFGKRMLRFTLKKIASLSMNELFK